MYICSTLKGRRKIRSGNVWMVNDNATFFFSQLLIIHHEKFCLSPYMDTYLRSNLQCVELSFSYVKPNSSFLSSSSDNFATLMSFLLNKNIPLKWKYVPISRCLDSRSWRALPSPLSRRERAAFLLIQYTHRHKWGWTVATTTEVGGSPYIRASEIAGKEAPRTCTNLA